ncbi:hypothetical protein JVT61DRAFT_11086 [Boletus reticuloceps]|uniref:Uncharacterized protein n=1 Tax=Boletus reticuloceps TaxID=495285 RepID=A0A8I3A5P4_9AGAM|nr:hypothetical protein JVT61DRAFT_11086 [Boletus reticuloceps]
MGTLPDRTPQSTISQASLSTQTARLFPTETKSLVTFPSVSLILLPPSFSTTLIPARQPSSQGALAQYATLPVDNVILKPAKLSWEEAAGLPLAAQTAVQSLRLGGYDPTRWLSLNPTSTPTPSNQEAIFFNGGSTRSGSPKPCRST